MEKYYFTEQIDKKFKSIDSIPEWLLNYPDFSSQIKTLRETLGMTQEQLSKKINRSVRSIQQIENGEAMPRISTLFKIAEALNTDLKISLVPKQNILEYLDYMADNKAKEIVRLSKTSSDLEIQPPSEDILKSQIENLKNEIIRKKRDILWSQKMKKR